MTEFIYSGKEKKLSEALQEQISDLGYFTLKALFRKGDVRINGKKVYSDCLINNGDIVRIYYKKPQREFTPFFENDLIACFFKPAKLACSGNNSLEEYVRSAYGYTLCHRLDTNTEGIVIFAKSDKIFSEIKEIFKNHGVEKHYLTAVNGILSGKKELHAFLLKNEATATVKIFDKRIPHSQEIVTRYETLYSGRNGSVLDVELVTGRTHQIRAHLAFIGHPIIGDPKYCPEKINRHFGRKYQLLRAYKIIFHVNSGVLKVLDGLKIEYDSHDYLEELKLIVEK